MILNKDSFFIGIYFGYIFQHDIDLIFQYTDAFFLKPQCLATHTQILTTRINRLSFFYKVSYVTLMKVIPVNRRGYIYLKKLIPYN